jgi:hypothetical protein
MDMTEQQRARLEVVRCYHRYTEALRSARLDQANAEVRRCRSALAHSIEAACHGDPHLLADFKRAFAARRSA